MKYKKALVIGAGAFGTSIASVIAHNFESVIVKVRREEQFSDILNNKNTKYLDDAVLEKNITPIVNLEEIEDKEELQLIVSGLPAKSLGEFFKKHMSFFEYFLKREVPFVSLSKGIDPDTLDLPDDVLFDIFYKYKDQFTFLSGPSFAKEIVAKQITMVSLAGRERGTLESVLSMLETDYFKLLPTYDIKGVLLGGALKNILAIAGGIIEGLGYNYNTRAAMITRGIVEMLRFGEVLNARPETFYGLSGMGDLILTTTGSLSRNKNFGLEIAKGREALEIINSAGHVIEGYKTTKAAKELAKKYKIRAQLFNGIYQILFENAEPKVIIESLMKAPINFE